MKRIILSGGGTGGHIYPAVAVAEALKRRFGDGVEILFVGAEGKMEMEKVRRWATASWACRSRAFSGGWTGATWRCRSRR